MIRYVLRIGLGLIVGLSSSSLTWATNGTWTDATSGGLWSATGNWSGGSVANGTDGIADFSTLNLTADNTVHLDSARTIGQLIFGDTTPSNNWILDNNGNSANTLTMAVSTGSPAITVNNQTATISAGLVGAGGFNKNGSGTLILSGSSTYTGTTTVNAGTLVLGNASALGTTAGGTTVASGATLDLGGQSVGAEGLAISGTGVGGNGALINSSVIAATFGGTITNQTFTVGGSGNMTLSGSINGTNTLTKIGTGTLTLSGTTDNNGLSLAVDAGTVVLAKTSSHAPNDVHAVGDDLPLLGMVVSGGTAQLGGTGGDQIYDSANVTVTSGTFDTNGQNETFATLNLQGTGIAAAGALVNTAAGSSAITPTSGTTLTGNTAIGVTQAAGSLTLNGAISGNFALTKVGPGELELTGTNSFSGSMMVNAGTLVLGNASALGTTAGGTTVASSATLDLGGQSVGAEGLTISGTGVGGNGALINSSATAATFGGTITNQGFTVGGSGNITLSGSINGPATLTKIGTGTLTLSGTTDNSSLSLAVDAGTVVLAKTSSHAPNDVHAVGWDLPLLGMVISGGTVQLGGTGGDQIYDSATVTVTSGTFDTNGQNETFATLKLQGTGIGGAGALVNSSGDSILTVTGGTVLTGAATIGVNIVSNGIAPVLELDNPISGSFALTKVGNGTLILNGTNTFSGGLTVASGSLQIQTINNASTSGPLGNNTSVTLGSSGNTADLVYTGGSASTNMPFVLAAGGTGALFNSLVGGNLTLNGTISGSGTLYVFAGTITLGGINSFTGGVTIGNGDVRLASGGALNSNAVTFLDNFGPSAPGKLSLQGHSVIVSGLSTSGSGTLQDVVQNGSATAATLTINNSTDNTFAGILQDGASSAALSILKSGSGALTLDGNSSFTGTMTVNAGTLVLGNTNALGTTAGATTVASGATLDLGGQTIGAEPLTISGTGVGGNGALINSSVIAATFGGTITNQTFTVGGSGNMTLSGSIIGTSALTKIGTGTLTLSGTTDNHGLSLAVDAGTVVLAKTSSHAPNDVHAVGWDLPLLGMVVSGGTAQLGGTGGDQIYDSATVTVTSGAFDTNGQNETFATLNLQGTGIGGAGALVNTAAGSSTITPTSGTTLTGNTVIGVTQAAGSLTLNGAISGNFALTKVGAGTLTLSGTSTYTGPTMVNAGKLAVNGSISGDVNVNTSGTLQGTGSVGGLVTVNSGGALSPGNSPGLISLGSLTLDAGAQTNIELGGTVRGSQYDAIFSTGAVSLNGTLVVSLINNFMPASGNSFDLLDWGTLNGKFASLQLPTLSAPLGWDTSQLYMSGVITATADLRGDINRDGQVTVADIAAMMAALANLSGYQSANGLSNQQLLEIADVNGDGAIDNSDVQALISLVASNQASGGSLLTPVPEPATLSLCGMGFSVLALRRIRRCMAR